MSRQPSIAGPPLRPGLLRTKITVPQPRPGLVDRAPLLNQLDRQVTPGRSGLVVAGSGWGKSTLLACWSARQSQRERCAWFSVDEGDDDIMRFWAYVLATLAPAGVPDRSAQLLSAAGTDAVDDVVPALLNELAAVSAPVTLVVDDYHLITNDEVHRSMATLLENLPATLRLVVSSRTYLPLPVVRLRGHGRLVDIGVDELRLSEQESAQLLQHELGHPLSEQDTALLHQRTEGWVTGLHLAALSLRARADPHAVIERFAGDDRHVGDYLLTEVLDRQPEEIRTFLRRTALLDRLCAPLCDALLGQAGSAELLDRVEQAQLFLEPLDNRREWYRYHHLFADVLRRDLHRAEPALGARLHRRAAEWFAAQNLLIEAVSHALASGDRRYAADLVAEHGVAVCFVGYRDTVQGWFDALGEDMCRAEARLCMARAQVASFAAETAEMDRWTDLAEDALRRPGLETRFVNAVHATVHLARWASAYAAGDVGAALRHAQLAHGLEMDDPAPWQALAALGWSLYRRGRIVEARPALSRAEALGEEHGDDITVVVSFGVDATIAAAEGRWDDAERLAARAERGGLRHALNEHYATGAYHFARGWVALQQGEHPAAAAAFRRALELVRRSPMQVDIAEVLTALAMTEHRLVKPAAAREHLAEARRILDRCPDPGRLLADPRKIRLEPAAPRVSLSEREVVVLQLVSEGLTNREIGERMQRSARTVDAHLRTIYRKIGVRTRSAATRYALEQENQPGLGDLT